MYKFRGRLDTCQIQKEIESEEVYRNQFKNHIIMLVELDRKHLVHLVKGCGPHYREFNNPLVKKAGHSFSDSTDNTSWSKLHELTDEELYQLYLICRNSW